MLSEEQRAFEYRRQQQAREDNRLARELRMRGSEVAAAAVRAAWEPLRRWRGWDPVRRVKGDAE